MKISLVQYKSLSGFISLKEPGHLTLSGNTSRIVEDLTSIASHEKGRLLLFILQVKLQELSKTLKISISESSKKGHTRFTFDSKKEGYNYEIEYLGIERPYLAGNPLTTEVFARYLPSSAILMHELVHVMHSLINHKALVERASHRIGVAQSGALWGDEEERAATLGLTYHTVKTLPSENSHLEALGLPPRCDHSGAFSTETIVQYEFRMNLVYAKPLQIREEIKTWTNWKWLVWALFFLSNAKNVVGAQVVLDHPLLKERRKSLCESLLASRQDTLTVNEVLVYHQYGAQFPVPFTIGELSEMSERKLQALWCGNDSFFPKILRPDTPYAELKKLAGKVPRQLKEKLESEPHYLKSLEEICACNSVEVKELFC
ncbi:MAG: type III secretion system effector protein [Simkaniaceae bacterium]|nr:type III secretion system effector protein [Simkaniaceae bacterium]